MRVPITGAFTPSKNRACRACRVSVFGSNGDATRSHRTQRPAPSTPTRLWLVPQRLRIFRLSLNTLSPTVSMFRSRDTMEDTPTTPITVLKCRTPCITHIHRTNSTSSSASSLSYPQIPSRRSSLSASVEYDPSDPAASTRTPSLSDSLYNIDVVKIRQDHAAASRGIRKTGMDVNEDPFIDQVIATMMSIVLFLLTVCRRHRDAVLILEKDS